MTEYNPFPLNSYLPSPQMELRTLVVMPQDIPGLDRARTTGLEAVRGTTSGMTNTPNFGDAPWVVSETGTDDLTVGPGLILGSRADNITGVGPVYAATVVFAGSDVTVSGAGWIYAYCATSATQLFNSPGTLIGDVVTYTLRPAAPVIVVFSTDDPDTIADGSAGEYWFTVAEVDLVAGEAVVIEQILTYNPLLNTEYVDVLA